MKYLAAALATTALLCPFAASATQPCCRDTDNPRWYASMSGSVVMLRDTDIENTSTIPGFVNPDTITFSPGFGLSGAVGYRILSGVRGELEVAYRVNEVDSDPNDSTLNPDGTVSEHISLALMSNLYIDFHNDSPYTPYIGFGAGAVHIESPRYYVISSGGNPIETLSLKQWTLAYQAMIGVNYKIQTQLTPFELTLGYRYFTGQDAEREFKTDGAKVKFPNASHNLELGGRIYF